MKFMNTLRTHELSLIQILTIFSNNAFKEDVMKHKNKILSYRCVKTIINYNYLDNKPFICLYTQLVYISNVIICN